MVSKYPVLGLFRGGTQNILSWVLVQRKAPVWVLFQRRNLKYPVVGPCPEKGSGLGHFPEEGSKISRHGSFSRGWTQNVLVWVLPEERNRMSQFGSVSREGTPNVPNLCPFPELGPQMS